MSDFYVPGFTPSGEGYICYIFPDGTVIKPKNDGTKDKDKGMFDVYKGIPVPDHGRLVDASALLQSIKEARKAQPEIADVYDDDFFLVAEWVYSSPTIIPASGGNENE